MSEFLAPINYDRARDVLRRLNAYTTYTPDAAHEALDALRQCYPLIFSKMEEKSFENDAILLEYAGADVTGPLVFTAHLDVNRPAAMGAVPLSRAHLVALLEAVEELLRDGFCPVGSLMLALSMDGLAEGRGAQSIARYLGARRVNPCFVLDYGGYATMEAFRTYLPKDAPVALIGVAEKGRIHGVVTARSGRQYRLGPAERVIRAGARLTRHEKQAGLCTVSRDMLRTLGKRAPAPQRWLAQQPRLFFPLMRLWWRKRTVMNQFFVSQRQMSSLSASGQHHAPAAEARLEFCQTLMPGHTADGCIRKLKVLAGTGVDVRFPVKQDPSPVSLQKGEAWDALQTAIEIQFERAVMAPCLCPFETDSRFYSGISNHIYRFSPFMVTGREALAEVCTVTDGTLQTAVQFFRSMLSV